MTVEMFRKDTRLFEDKYSALYKAKMERLSRNICKWTSNEPNVRGDLIERYLWLDGRALIWKHDVLGWIVTGCSETAWNINGYAEAWKPYTEYPVQGIIFPDELTTKDDCICVYEWNERYVRRTDVLFLCDELADVNETIRQQVWNQKTPLMAIAGNTSYRDKLKNAIVKLKENINVLFLDKDIASDLKTLDLNAPFNIIELHQHKKYIENEILEWLGIDATDANPKKERMIVDEQEANDETLNYILADMLNARLLACDQATEKGLTLTVEIQRSVRPEDTDMEGDPDQPNDDVRTGDNDVSA